MSESMEWPLADADEVLDGLNKALDSLLHYEGESMGTDAVAFASAYVEANADEVDEVLCPHCPE